MDFNQLLERLREDLRDFIANKACPTAAGLDFTLCDATCAKFDDDCMTCWLTAISRFLKEEEE